MVPPTTTDQFTCKLHIHMWICKSLSHNLGANPEGMCIKTVWFLGYKFQICKVSEAQLNLTPTYFKGPTNFICYRQTMLEPIEKK